MASNLKNLSDFSHLEIRDAANIRFAIVVSQWNSQVTGALLNGAVDGLLKHGALESDIKVIQVPGSFELTSGADIALRDQNLDAVICLGCVIQANGVSNVAVKYNKPVIFGVLTTDNLEQAMDRAGGKHGNKGEEAAITAIQMAHIHKSN
jgi:6,7-dimethyl-8-ribityllumazine synthase